jgi:acetyl-CoA/propionyl-CoA carboxylase carboxyl transferase subunit
VLRLLVVDTLRYLPGVEQEVQGIVRRGAKPLQAYAEACVPRLTLITRRAYGDAYIAMGLTFLGADAVLAWPTAEVAAMGPEAAVRLPYRK